MATRQGRIIDPCRVPKAGCDCTPFLSILCNNIQIYGKDTEKAPPLFIIKTLVERGAVAYLRTTGDWFAFSNAGRKRRTGQPDYIRLYGDFGKLSAPIKTSDKNGDICIIPANAYYFPPKADIMRKVDTLSAISTALGQNMDALKQSAAIIYDDPALTQQIEYAEAQRLSGAPTVKLLKSIGQNIQIENFSPAANSHIPDFISLWTQTLEELDAATGRATLGEKNERRITDEVSVIENSACTAIDVIIDTFNRFAEWYGIEAYAERGTELRYTANNSNIEEEENDKDVNAPQKSDLDVEVGRE